MRGELIKNILQNEDISSDFLAFLQTEPSQQVHKKGYALLKKGEVCTRIWLLAKGLAKSRYFDQNGKQLITRFWRENDIILAKESFNNRTPASEDIILLEDALIFSIDHLQAQYMYSTFPESHRLARRTHSTEERQNRLRFHLLTLPAPDAYELFCQEFKSVPFNRFQQQDIAAYLNLSPHTISMIRRRR